MASASFWLFGQPARPDPALAEAWSPLDRADANVLVCLATPAHLLLVPYPEGPIPSSAVSLTAPREVNEWYQKHRTMPPGNRLYMHTTNNAIPLGEALGTLALAKVLNAFASSHQILSERVMSTSALRGRNAIVIGNPDYSAAAEKLLERGVLSIYYDPATQERMIRPAKGTGTSYAPKRDQHGYQSEAFGLITVLPSEGSTDSRLKTLVFSGTNSAATQAAVEFFGSAGSVRTLRERFRKEGHAGFPAAYQVVIRCRTDNVLPLGYSYETHVVLPGPK